ncbi:hypothetical protein F2Q68_00000869 [Brassica cretica]|uniref:Uncharacterized protein n=1 Tax=Brassica cretica TaxID=69181 RepID=A0A8S9J652_BRACR|nr:hypothetical protein F2Q68_00000869 [Brassica cretica]
MNRGENTLRQRLNLAGVIPMSKISASSPKRVDYFPNQGEYLPTVWDDTPKVLMEHIMVAADVFDACLLSNVLGFLGAKINGYLDEGLPLIAGRFEFARST